MAHAEDFGDIRRTIDILGGTKLIRQPVRNRLEVHDVIASGLPARVLSHMVGAVPLLGNALEPAIGISQRTFQRRRDDGSRRLSPEQSGRAWKFAEILGRATEVLGSQLAAEDWLKTPAMALDQRRPIDLLATPAGVEAVEDQLERMEYGVYA